ncbi:YafY family transcriptional regulator [Nonomuraea mesophila]|uniref:YafY family transcriptional regulator n=1 Tax=Nonomuraea mesophila TaxID=2530382 RepID=A0A4V2ZBJ3_9ACTN|nr:YafY family protein [Nonomuraea mesophila]TDE57699.1 YafY family transcriptional regulator [Nonomuraea mesophila]
MSGPTSRLLSLLSLLQTQRTWPGRELAERLGVTHRTVRRDVERLREMGYPVAADLGAHGGYRLIAGSALPPLLLEDDEAIAVALGLRTVAVQGVPELEEAGLRALAKLSNSLPVRLRHRVRALGGSISGWVPPGRTADPDVLTTLAVAAAGGERLRMRYRDRKGEMTARHVEPQRLVSAHHRWYLVAFDIDRRAWRTFRADRIQAPRGTGARTSQRLSEEDVRTHLAQAALAMAPVHRADVTLHLTLAEAVLRLQDHLGDGSLTPEGDRTRWRSACDTVEWLALRLLSLDCPFEVHSPPALLDHLARIHDHIRTTAPGDERRSDQEPPTASDQT